MCDASKGRPIDDGTIRLYTKGECDSLGGMYHGNGECTKAEGGSWSWDCRGLNSQGGSGAPVVAVGQSGSASGMISSMAQAVSSPAGGGDGGLDWKWLVGGAVVAYAVYKISRRGSR